MRKFEVTSRHCPLSKRKGGPKKKEIKVIHIPEAKQAGGAWRSVHDVLQYLIAIPEVKDAIKKMDQKLNLDLQLMGGGQAKGLAQ